MAKNDSAHLRLCPLIAFDQIAGGKYKLRTQWVRAKKPCRYGAIRRSLVIACQGKPVTPRISSRELKELQDGGLIVRKQFPEVPRGLNSRCRRKANG